MNKAHVPMRRALFDLQRWGVWPGICAAVLLHSLGIAIGLLSQNRPTVWLVYMGLQSVILVGLLFYYRTVMGQAFAVLGLSLAQLRFQMVLGLRWIIFYFTIGNLSVYFLSIFLLKVLILPQVFEGFLVRQREAMGGGAELLALVEGEWGAGFLWMPVVFLVLVGPVLEELIFRGFLYGPMRRTAGPIIAAVLTAILFMLGHGQIALNPFVFGLLFAYLYESTQSLAPSILFHILINLRSVELYLTRQALISPELMMAEAGGRALFFVAMLIVVWVMHRNLMKKGISLQISHSV